MLPSLADLCGAAAAAGSHARADGGGGARRGANPALSRTRADGDGPAKGGANPTLSPVVHAAPAAEKVRRGRRATPTE